MSTPLYTKFKSFVDLAYMFKDNIKTYFLIKNFAFTTLNYRLNKDKNCINENELNEYMNLVNTYKGELNSFGGNDPSYNKEGYENFLDQVFSNIKYLNYCPV